MTAPHTVSLICYHGGEPRLTILRGVMVQDFIFRSSLNSGVRDDTAVSLHIPLDVDARSAEGESQTFLPPLRYAEQPDPSPYWTLQPEGESAGRCGFYVEAELSEPLSLREARARFDDVFLIAGYTLRNYGSPSMQHWEVRSRFSSRYYGS